MQSPALGNNRAQVWWRRLVVAAAKVAVTYAKSNAKLVIVGGALVLCAHFLGPRAHLGEVVAVGCCHGQLSV